MNEVIHDSFYLFLHGQIFPIDYFKLLETGFCLLFWFGYNIFNTFSWTKMNNTFKFRILYICPSIFYISIASLHSSDFLYIPQKYFMLFQKSRLHYKGHVNSKYSFTWRQSWYVYFPVLSLPNYFQCEARCFTPNYMYIFLANLHLTTTNKSIRENSTNSVLIKAQGGEVKLIIWEKEEKLEWIWGKGGGKRGGKTEGKIGIM